MHEFDWDDVRHFLETARAGSLSKAARRLNVNYTTVSRRISALERDLAVALFDRTGSDWALTAAGEKILIAAENMADTASVVLRKAISESHEIRGKLRVTAAGILFERLIMDDIRDFSLQYPEVELELIATDDLLSLSAREADIAIRGTNNPPPNVIGKQVAHIAYGVYGTETIRAKHENGEPVPTITWIGDGRSQPEWIKKSFSDTPTIMRVDTPQLMIEMTKRGLGAAQLACGWGEPDPLLHRLPNAPPEAGLDLWVLAHTDVKRTERVRVFRDFIVARLQAKRALFEGVTCEN